MTGDGDARPLVVVGVAAWLTLVQPAPAAPTIARPGALAPQIALPVVGGGMMVEMASTNTVLQTIVEDDMRGRVMSFYTMAFLGTAPLGSLLAGFLADHVGPMDTVRLGGAACVLAAGIFSLRLRSLRAHVRPIYIERGILAAAEIEGGSKSL